MARAMDAREVGAGVLFAAFGVVVITYARQYELGTATQMGPGFFPTMLGVLLVLLGGVAVAQGLRQPARVPIGAFPFIPTLFVLAAVLVFAVLIADYGLVPAVAAVVVLACYERLLRRPVEVAIIVVSLVVLTVGIFLYGIQLPLQLW